MSYYNKFRKILNNKAGFSLVEVIVSLGLLTIVSLISINLMLIVLNAAKKVDYQITVTQESSYAVERIRRVVRSSNLFKIGDAGDSLFVISDAETITFQVTNNQLFEDGQSIMSSDVGIFKVNEETPYFSAVSDGGNLIGVRMSFQVFDSNDSERTAGTIVSSQSINRNLILNK